jgi:prepilin-type N-terminal cleavage/methylation domain-containing protein
MRRRGLSLIELLVVVAIILIVFLMVIITLAKVYHIIENWKK